MTIIGENERGFLFRNGKFIKMLGPGTYNWLEWQFWKKSSSWIECVKLKDKVFSEYCPLDRLLADKDVEESTIGIEVLAEELVLHFVDGKFKEVLESGRYAFWKSVQKHEFIRVSIAVPEVSEDVPRYLFQYIPIKYCTKFEVKEYQKGRLYFDNRFVRVLDAGMYYFWNGKTRVKLDLVDTRSQLLNIVGQEILTKDKVSLRINFVCLYQITNYERVATESDDYQEQIHVAAQLALRDYVGRYRLDEILEDKESVSDYVKQQLKKREKEWYICFLDAGVKDIILPGEIREIMNTVLIAEKRAQANVIARREEVASTRSLLNTAKLMDENRTLYKLKELECLQKICENVGTITVGGGSDLLGQLVKMLDRGEAE